MPNILCVPLTYSVTTGEHNGHVDAFGNPLPHSGDILGEFLSGTSNLRVNGNEAILHQNTSSETCFDDGGGSGTLIALPCKVKVNGKYVATVGSKVVTHAGVEKVLTTGNSKVFIGGM